MNKMVLHTPTLYSVSSTGKVKEWTVSVEGNPDGSATIIRNHGYHGEKIQRIEKVISNGKNIGKSNETTPYQQAVSEALSLRQKRIDLGFTEVIPNLDTYVETELPMLAQPFEKRKHNIKYPAYVQPKLNGVRCLAKKVSNDKIVYISRKGKEYTTLEHLTPDLLKRMSVGQILDGEIYVHGMTFQNIVRLVKKFRPESTELEYHIYDIAEAGNVKFTDRHVELNMILAGTQLNYKGRLVNVETISVNDEKSVYDMHNIFVSRGYEGVIIRNRDGYYKFDNRSSDLQKYKQFEDAEFEIVGGEEGTGLHEGCVIFRVKNKNNQFFNVYPRGSLEMRKEMYKNIKNYVGKMLTVRYQELSEDGIPIFPVGIEVRDYE